MYKIYKAQITQHGSPATLIVATTQHTAGYYKAESFCVFPDPHPGQSYSALRFDPSAFESTSAEAREAILLEEAVGQGRMDIARHIDTRYADENHLIHKGGLVLTEVDSSYLVQLWVRKAADFLPSIRDRTSCEALRELITPILKLPSVARREV